MSKHPLSHAHRSLRLLTIGAALCWLLVSGCDKATYSADRITESLTTLCRTEHQLNVTVRLIGKTLWTYLPLEHGLLDDAMRISEEAADAIEHVVLDVHRVTMSTDATIDFYVVVIADTGKIGAELTLIGYTQDVRRARLLDISRDEYQKRLIRELKLNPKAIANPNGSYLQMADIYMPKFLAEQVCRRIRIEFQLDPILSNRFDVRSAEWRLDGARFRFLLNIKPRVPDATWHASLAEAADVITDVFRGYSYRRFDSILIEELNSGTTLELSSADQLDLLHRGKLTVDQLVLPIPLPQ